MRDIFDAGTKLRLVAGAETNGDAFVCRIGSWPAHCREITVVMVPGPTQHYPWAHCQLNDGRVKMVNLMTCQEVELLDEQAAA